MTFEEAVAQQPMWVQWWINFMGVVIVLSTILMLIFKGTRRDGLIVLGTNFIVFASMMWAYGEFGYVRLLGIVHVVLWTPLAWYLWNRRTDPQIHKFARFGILALIATMVVSLVMDYADVVRYLMGETAPLV